MVIFLVTCFLSVHALRTAGEAYRERNIGGNALSGGFDVMDDLEKHRWERLLRWLSEEHGMDVGESAFHVEAREVPGMSCICRRDLAISMVWATGAGRGLFATRDCPVSRR